MSESKAKLTEELLLTANVVAEQEALLSFIISTLRASTTFDEFKAAIEKNLDEVKINPTINVEEYLDTFDNGYVILVKTEQGHEDYYRTDDGLPMVFGLSDVVPSNIKPVKVIELDKRFAERQARKMMPTYEA